MSFRDSLFIDLRTFIWGPPEERRERGRKPWPGPRSFRKSRRLRALMIMSDHLASIVRANASLPDGLDAATADAPTYQMKRLFATLANDLDSGMALSESLARRRRFFPPFYVDMIRAGEETGRLGDSFLALRAIVQRTLDLHNRAIQYAAYIGCVWIFILIAGASLTNYILPSFGEILKDFGARPPALWYAAMSLGREGPKFLLGGLLAAVVIWQVLKFTVSRSATLSGAWGWIALRVPVIRGLVAKRNLAHAAYSLAQFLHARVPLDEALDATASLSLNAVYRRSLERVRDRVRAGSSLKAALESWGRVFPPSFVGFVSVGETSGRLPEALERIEQLYRRQVARTERVLLDVLSPLGILAAGVVVLVYFASLFVSMASIVDTMGGM